MKYLLVGLTSTEDVRKLLNDCINNSHYDHKTLAMKLSRLYPLENWTERSINYMLSESNDISTAKANQILDFLFPEEKFEFSREDIREKIEEMHERLENLRAEYNKSVKDKVIDDREYNLLKSNVNVLGNMIKKFEELTLKVVNVQLS